MFRIKLREPLHKCFLKNCRFTNNTSDKIIKKNTDVSMGEILNNGKWYRDMPTVVMGGSVLGTCIGSYYGYQNTKKDTYAECLLITLWCGWLGGTVGYIATLICPITIPIVIAVTIARQIEPEKTVSNHQS